MKLKRTLILFIVILLTWSASQAQIALSGKVVNESNEPLVGAAVVMIGTTIGKATSVDGTFSINIEEFPVKLSISYMGYKTAEVEVKSAAPVLIKLSTEFTAIEDLVVVGSRGRSRTVMA